MPNPMEMLHEDHEKVSKLLEKLTDTTTRAEKTRADLLTQIDAELEVHNAIEEEIFYPALREAASSNGDKEQVAEGYEEHRAVKRLVLPDLQQTEVTSIEFGGRAKVLKELVTHHAEEEEEELFDLAKQLLSAEQLDDLGTRMQARKQELLARKS